jgi:hypothetical protein
MNEPCILLVDNGSIRPDSTLSLRQIAAAVTEHSGHKVNAVSLLHSSKVSADRLGGIPAEIFEPYVIKHYDAGIREFVILPLFFGHTAAIYEYLPQRVREIEKERPELKVRIAPCLVDLTDASDTLVAEILADLVREKIAEEGLIKPAVTLVDHGTPRIAVNMVRNHLADQLKVLLKEDASVVEASSMERREEEEYAYNEPLLENILGSPGFEKDVVLSMLFMSPGRHAGPGGDIAEICEKEEENKPGLKTYMSGLFATHHKVIPLLSKRLEQGLASEPITGEVAPSFQL